MNNNKIPSIVNVETFYIPMENTLNIIYIFSPPKFTEITKKPSAVLLL